MTTEYCLPYVYRILPTICLQNFAYHLSTENCLPYVYGILPTICLQNIAYHLLTEYCLPQHGILIGNKDDRKLHDIKRIWGEPGIIELELGLDDSSTMFFKIAGNEFNLVRLLLIIQIQIPVSWNKKGFFVNNSKICFCNL